MTITSAIWQDENSKIIKSIINGAEIFVPDDMGNVYRQMIAGWEMEGNTISPYVPPPPPPYMIAKTTPWLRTTEDEAEQLYAQMQLTSPRLRGIYDAAQYLSSGDELWQTLHDIIAATLGSSRADELLAPEG